MSTNNKPATMIVKRKPKANASFLVLSKSRLAGDFSKLITAGDILSTVSAVFDVNDNGEVCQLAYEGDIVLSCQGDSSDPQNYRVSTVVPKVGAIMPTSPNGHTIIPAQLERAPLDMSVILLACSCGEIINYMSQAKYVPTNAFLVSGMTIRQMRNKKNTQRKHIADNKKAV